MSLGPLTSSLLMPPMIFIVMALAGLLASWRWRRAGFVVATISMLLLYVCSTPLASSSLLAMTAAQVIPRHPGPSMEPQAIILVTADVRWANSPVPRDEPGPLTLERIVETARIYRSHGLPVLVTGGVFRPSGRSLAAMASTVLERDFQVPVRWREERSTNTFENGAFSAQILAAEGISTAFVVAQGWDLPRILWSFDQAGIAGVPAPAGLPPGVERIEFGDFLPGHRGFQDSYYALHELLGLQYYRWRYGERAAR